eukprot:m51a1_g7977 hypothetical protein (155) ;mRNA; f:46589-47325
MSESKRSLTKKRTAKGRERVFSDDPEPRPEAAEESSSDDESSSDEEVQAKAKPKGTTPIISADNPNRGKIPGQSTELNRKEREAMDKERARAAYVAKTLAGKTEEARKDLDRLARIRKEREEAAKRREQEKAEKEAARQAALGTRGKNQAPPPK